MVERRLKTVFLFLFMILIMLNLLNFISAASCWSYTSSSICNNAIGCNWKNDSWSITGWCEELNCWSLGTNTACTTTNIPGKNCTWQGGGITYGCEQLSCYSLSGTNANSCENNSFGLNCGWSNNCWQSGTYASSGVSSPNCYQYTNQSACLNASSCSWGNCNERGCWNYGTQGTCNAAKDYNGKNCTWNPSGYCQQNGCWKYNNQSDCIDTVITKGLSCQWKYNSCQDIDCYTWDGTDAATCINNSVNLSCTWSNNWCTKKDCWSYNTQATCQNQSSCNWKAYTSAGWCQEVNCYTWDSWNRGTNSSCVNNGSIYGLNCLWSGNPVGNLTSGWCYKNIALTSCVNKTTERDCMDTFYCWWQYHDWNNSSAGGICNEPGGFGGSTTNTSIFNEWNPKCYIFDKNATDCNNTLGCNFTDVCLELNNSYGRNISLKGINCSYINDSQLCNNIPVLSSCCSWNNGSCIVNKLSSACRDQVQQKSEDSCEDAKTQTRCDQMANSPWYMPCIWENATSKCDFKITDIFGNGSRSLIRLDNKMNCQAAGGKWIVENYCEGNMSIPAGRCEYKFDEEDNCDKTCFACEIKDSNGNSVNASNAETACQGSKLGSCDFAANTNAPNRIGYCKAKTQFKKGIAGDCDSSCGDCTFKGYSNNNDTTKRPSYFCTISKANSAGGGCKWISDNSTLTGGYCVNKGEKTCEDACDRCKTQTDCSNLGRTAVSNQTGSCKWQGSSSTGSCVNNVAGDVEICWNGIDDNNNNLIDCSDQGCFADSYCGFVEGDCFVYNTSAKCYAHNSTCEWVTDNWGSWCDFKGSQCWKYNSGSSACGSMVSVANQTLNITLARINGNNNINISYEFAFSNLAMGLVANSFIVLNGSTGVISSGNYTIDYANYRIVFLNTSYMVSGEGARNFTNISYKYYNTNCQWSNGTGNGWCEKNWSVAEVCMGLNRTNCMALNASGCNWTVDSWCSGSGNGSSWCSSGGGWCDHNSFKPKNCWLYSGSGTCSAVTGCSWKTDSFSQARCEVNWSANCWQYTSNETCSNTTLNSGNCVWDTPIQGGGWCMNKADKCWSYSTQASCDSALNGRCYWQSWGSGGTGGGSCQSICWNSSYSTQSVCNEAGSLGCSWKSENGWCEESNICFNSTNSNNQINCQNASITNGSCVWKQSGWCDPKGGGFTTASAAGGGGTSSSMSGDCYKYDGNQSLCTNKSIINSSCGWTVNPSPICEVDWSKDCWKYTSVDNGCNITNGCWFRNETSFGSFCTNIAEQCWQNGSYQTMSVGWAQACNLNQYCRNTSFGCEPKCSSQTNVADCNRTFCKWTSGWCNSKAMNEMFNGMEAGAPVPLAMDNCNEEIQASVDLCGFGMKDMGDSYGIGGNVRDFSNSSVCNKEKLSSFVMGMAASSGGVGGPSGGFGGGGATTFGTEKTGAGNDTIIFIVYLDSDGSTTGGCTLDFNSSASGYEFRFKYTSQWNVNTSKAVETFNSDKCDDSSWKATDIKFSAWKKKMCSEIGGPMIAFKKADLTKYPSLYDSTKDIKIFVATIGNTGNITYPSDSAGPGWTTPGSIDFEIKSAFDYGADSAKFEDILKKGFVQGEDCFNGIDDDNDGNIDCNDWDCQYSSKCSGTGVNAAGYSDTSAPLVTGVKIEEYPNAALVMYDTNKPTNGTLELYGYGDTQCLNKTNNIYDIGILSASVSDYKLWHTALIYETNETMNGKNVSINWPLVSGSSYNYKLKVCDSNNRCSISKCSNFTTPLSSTCGYCDFVTRIKVPAGWKVAYDVDRNGSYEHVQGEVCGPNAGMKMNYTLGRKVNVKLYKTDGSTYIEFLNASLTKTGLNDKVRTISSSGSMISDATKGTVGLNSETRDKIINNLHPEICRIKIPIASGTICNTLYHCDDNGANCTDRTSAAGGAPVDAVNCVWNVPNCEFSTYKGASASSGTTTTSSGGGGGGGAGGKTYTISESQFNEGYTQSLGSGDKIKFVVSGENHSATLIKISATSATISIASKSQSAIFSIGDEKSFDINEDGKNDLSVKLNSITNLKASFTIKSISSGTVSTTSVTGQATGSEEQGGSSVTLGTELQESKNNLVWIWVVIGVVIALLIIGFIFYFARKKKDY